MAVAVNCCVPPVTTEAEDGETVMEVSTGGLVTVTLAVPLTLPLAAVTVKGPPAVEPAVNSPLELIVPPPLTDQVKVGCGFSGLPVWSLAVAVNCCVPPVTTEAEDGETVMLLRTDGALPQVENLKEAIRVLQLKLPLAFRYSVV